MNFTCVRIYWNIVQFYSLDFISFILYFVERNKFCQPFIDPLTFLNFKYLAKFIFFKREIVFLQFFLKFLFNFNVFLKRFCKIKKKFFLIKIFIFVLSIIFKKKSFLDILDRYGRVLLRNLSRLITVRKT